MGPVGSGGVRWGGWLYQTRPIPRSPDGDKKNLLDGGYQQKKTKKIKLEADYHSRGVCKKPITSSLTILTIIGKFHLRLLFYKRKIPFRDESDADDCALCLCPLFCHCCKFLF